MTKHAVGFLVVCVAASWGVQTALAADQAAERTAIKKRIASYTAAFNARDARALAAHWLPGAVYVNPNTGTQVRGRDAIEKEFKAELASLKDTKLVVDVQSIRFISPSVAVEEGHAKLVGPGSEVQESTYTAIHVKRDNEWFLDRVTEEEIPVVKSHYDQLKELEWMIGTWVDADEQSEVKTTCQWSRNKNFIIRWFTVRVRDRIDLTGMQVIGWDPALKQIRSWVFDSAGGIAEGRWRKKGKQWYVTTTGVLAEGGKASSVNIITYVDDDRFKWQSVNRMADGQLLPNIDEVIVVRAVPAKAAN